jgi:hypothetical protein
VPPHPARTATTAEAVSSALRIARQSVGTAIPRPVNSSTYPQRHHGTILPQPGMTPAGPETPEVRSTPTRTTTQMKATATSSRPRASEPLRHMDLFLKSWESSRRRAVGVAALTRSGSLAASEIGSQDGGSNAA